MARIVLAALSIACVMYLHGRPLVTIDGTRLMATPRPSPFHLRWLLPTLLGKRLWAWAAVSWASLLCTAVLMPGDIWACALWVSLPWFRTMAAAPVLVDAPAFALSLVAQKAPGGYPVALMGWLGAMVSERLPVFMALMAWSAWPLLGLWSVFVLHRIVPHTPRQGPGALAVGQSRAFCWCDPAILLLPWGAGLAAVFSAGWTLQEVALIAVAYGQLLVAHDTSRLYMWCAPVVLPRAVAVLPTNLRLAAVLATWFNPWAKAQKGQVMV
jgi:hypothetical protein